MTSGRPASGPALFGRAADLARLRTAWTRARPGRPVVVGVEGAAGLGKTALVRRFTGSLDDVAVRFAGSEPEEFGAPFQVLGELLSGGSPTPPGALPDGAADPFLLGRRLASSFGRSPTVLVVDDAHRADARSLKAVRHALAAAGGRVLLVLAFRPPTPQERRAVVNHDWDSLFPELERLELRGLSAADLAELAVIATAGGRRLPIEAAKRLHERTGGNPLFAVQLLKQLSMRDLVSGVGLLQAPATIELAVTRNLTSLSEPTRELVGLGAVIGRRFGPAALVEVASRVSPALVTAVDTAITEALEAGLLEEDADGARLNFVSDDVRIAVYHHQPRARRQEVHRAAVRLNLDDSVRHRLAAADPADPDAAEAVFRFARERYRHGAVHLAAQYMRAALELVPRSSPARRPLLLETVEALLVAGDLIGADELSAEVSALPAGAWRDYAAGYLALLHADVDGASAGLQAALIATVEPGAPADLSARVHTQLAVLAIVSLDRAGMRSHGARGIALDSRDPALTSFAWFAWTIGLALGGEGERALRELASSPALDRNLDALVARGMIRLWLGALDAAGNDLSEVAERTMQGEALRVGQAFAFLSEVRYRQGRLDEATRLARWAIDDAMQNERVWDYSLVHALAVFPLAARGRFDEAVEAARLASQYAWTDVGRAYATGAWVAIAQARPASPERLLALGQELDATGYAEIEPGTHLLAGVTAEALAALGRVDEASAALWPLPARTSARMSLTRARAAVLLAAGDRSGSAEACFEALRLAEKGGLPLEAVRVRLLLARVLDVLGRRREATEVLRAALAQATALSASAYAAQARAQLETRSPAASELLATLTGRQRAVVELSLDGLTRKQIAARLDRSLKVVEGHFTAIFKRLGVTSTAELRELFGR